MKIEIDNGSGFCFGVERAIQFAENELNHSKILYSLGDIVHNKWELDRLKNLGLQVIDYEAFRNLKDTTVLIRAHGEPPETYELAKKNNISLIDATCPIVDVLQKKIRKGFNNRPSTEGQILIYGKENHPEVRALVGQTGGTAKVIKSVEDLKDITLHIPIQLYSQTTMDPFGFKKIVAHIRDRLRKSGDPEELLSVHYTICKEVCNRKPNLEKFASNFEMILFVSGIQSSNGKMLFEVCKSVNPNSHFISAIDDLNKVSFSGIASIGICGATSTPRWLLEEVKKTTEDLLCKD